MELFEKIPGVHGKLINNRAILITGDTQAVVKKLKVVNKAVLWEIQQAKKGLKSDNPQRAKFAENKLKELLPHQFMEYFYFDDNGQLIIPAGFYYLCETFEKPAVVPVTPIFTSYSRDYQKEAVTKLLSVERGLVEIATGCHAKDQELLMFSGHLKKVQDIVVGDVLMGVDSQPRVVKSLHRGIDQMYRISPTKGKPFIVNKEHILSLEITNMSGDGRCQKRVSTTLGTKLYGGDIINISVKDYLKQSPTFKHVAKLYRKPADFGNEESVNQFEIPPYILGCWLGDGNSDGTMLTTMDDEIRDSFQSFCESKNLNMKPKNHQNQGRAVSYTITGKSWRSNIFRDMLIENDLINNKHIPHAYKIASRKDRLEMLAGIIDTDGSLVEDGATFDVVFKNKRLADDVAFVARSLGFSVYIKPCRKMCYNSPTRAIGDYFRFAINGPTETIPVRLKRKQASPRQQIKSVLKTGFKVEIVGEDEFFGFSVDGDRLYLMDDFTVTHNCGKSLIIHDLCKSLVAAEQRCLIIVPTIDLLKQTIDGLKDLKVCGVGGKYKFKPGVDVCVATPISAANVVTMYDAVIIDESHHQSASTWYSLGVTAKKATRFYGLTGTCVRSDNLELGIHAWCGPIIMKRDAKWGVANNWLCPCKALLVKVNTPLMPDSMPSARAYGACIKHKETLKAVVEVMKPLIEKNLKVLIFVSTVKGGKFVALALKKAYNLDCEVASADYRKPFFDFKANKTNILISNHKLLGEGVDVPNIQVIVNLCNVKAESLTRQIVGRAIRLSPDKKMAFIVDLWFAGFSQYARAADTRRKIYQEITDNVKDR